MGFNGHNALGLGWFLYGLLDVLWEFVKDEVISFFRDFHKHGRCEEFECNFHYVDSKKGGSADLRDFRPLSLEEGSYK